MVSMTVYERWCFSRHYHVGRGDNGEGKDKKGGNVKEQEEKVQIRGEITIKGTCEE
jgi:hypothetical protein